LTDATLTRTGQNIAITLDSNVFTANGASHSLEVSAQIIGGSTMLPIRAVLESVGYALDWDDATRTVVITSGVTALPPATTVPTPEPAVALAPSVHEGNYFYWDDSFIEESVFFSTWGGVTRWNLYAFVGEQQETIDFYHVAPWTRVPSIAIERDDIIRIDGDYNGLLLYRIFGETDGNTVLRAQGHDGTMTGGGFRPNWTWAIGGYLLMVQNNPGERFVPIRHYYVVEASQSENEMIAPAPTPEPATVSEATSTQTSGTSMSIREAARETNLLYITGRAFLPMINSRSDDPIVWDANTMTVTVAGYDVNGVSTVVSLVLGSDTAIVNGTEVSVTAFYDRGQRVGALWTTPAGIIHIPLLFMLDVFGLDDIRFDGSTITVIGYDGVEHVMQDGDDFLISF